jgi:5-(carboxyamino)imidazole ribonucleotide mutase
MSKVKVSIIMGSDSDLGVMQEAADFLESVNIPHEITIVSAHRTPERMFEFARNAHKRGVKVIIAGAGGAAHLPGMVASLTSLPVIGVPVKSSNSIDGWDSVLSILQMNTRCYRGFERWKKCRNSCRTDYRNIRKSGL